MLTPEGGIPILYKDQDRGWFLMVLRVFAWIMATGVGGWLIFYKSSRSIQPAIGVFTLLMLIVRQTVEASHSVEIHLDGMIVDGRFFSAEDVGDNWPELQMKDDDPPHGHLRYLRHAPDDDRRLLELKGVGKSNRETADALRRSASAVEQRLYLLRDRAFFSSAVVAWPLAARAQGADRARHIAWLGLGRADEPSPYLDSLRAGLRELGWIEGRNLTIGVFWATGREDMEAAAREVLASNPEVIVTQELMAIAMLSSRTAKPVVFGFSGDPVDGKLAQSWARPGGNFTGMSYLAIELVGKRIELLKEWLPQTRRIAILARPQHPGAHLERQATEAVVKKLGIDFSYFPYQSQSFLPARDLGELETAFRAVVQDHCDALVVFPDSAMYEVSDRVAQFALQAKLPSVSGWSPFAQKGLLMTYGPDVRGLYRSLARYTDRILRGTTPADLPIEVPTKFYLAINLKTAKGLGLTVPPTLLARADEVIE